MSRQQSEMRTLQKQTAALHKKMREKLKEEIVSIFNANRGEENRLSAEEIARKALHKGFVSQKDIDLIKLNIQYIRRDCETNGGELIVCLDGRYGWAEDKETVDAYTLKNLQNGMQKIKRNVKRYPKNLDAIGCSGSINDLIGIAEKDFGFKMLEYGGTKK